MAAFPYLASASGPKQSYTRSEQDNSGAFLSANVISFFIYNFRGISAGSVDKCIHQPHFPCSISFQKDTCLIAWAVGTGAYGAAE